MYLTVKLLGCIGHGFAIGQRLPKSRISVDRGEPTSEALQAPLGDDDHLIYDSTSFGL